MQTLRRQTVWIAVLLLAAVMAPSTMALTATWHVAKAHGHGHLDHEHAEGGEHEHHDEHEHEHAHPHSHPCETPTHDTSDHQGELTVESADGSRPSNDELRGLDQVMRIPVVRMADARPTDGVRAGEVERPPEPPGLPTLCKLQI